MIPELFTIMISLFSPDFVFGGMHDIIELII